MMLLCISNLLLLPLISGFLLQGADTYHHKHHICPADQLKKKKVVSNSASSLIFLSPFPHYLPRTLPSFSLRFRLTGSQNKMLCLQFVTPASCTLLHTCVTQPIRPLSDKTALCLAQSIHSKPGDENMPFFFLFRNSSKVYFKFIRQLDENPANDKMVDLVRC